MNFFRYSQDRVAFVSLHWRGCGCTRQKKKTGLQRKNPEGLPEHRVCMQIGCRNSSPPFCNHDNSGEPNILCSRTTIILVSVARMSSVTSFCCPGNFGSYNITALCMRGTTVAVEKERQFRILFE